MVKQAEPAIAMTLLITETWFGVTPNRTKPLARDADQAVDRIFMGLRWSWAFVMIVYSQEGTLRSYWRARLRPDPTRSL